MHLMLSALAKLILLCAKANEVSCSLVRRLKVTASDMMMLAHCTIELPNVQVSDTTKDDSSNTDRY